MKKLSFFHSLMAALALTVAFTSCTNDDDEDGTPSGSATAHYDLTVTVGLHGGMSKDKSHITLSVNSLNHPDSTIDFRGNGAEITEYTTEAIYDGEYIYQIPTSDDRFSKLQFKDNKMNVIQEQIFKTNKYVSRKYTHAWVGRTLIIVAADGNNENILWTKLNADDMTIIAEDTLDLTPTPGYAKLTTTGILTYRQSDKKLFYFYYGKGKVAGDSKDTNEPFFHIAVINPETMEVESDKTNTMASQMQGSAYGELLQNIVFFDEQDNLYLSVFNSVSKKNIGQVLRIKKGETDFEAGYNAFPGALGKICSIQYLGNNKALAYSGDASVGTGIQDVAYYYSILDLTEKKATRLQYNGTDIAYSGGSFSQRSCFNAKEKKAYFGVSTADEECVYIYDVATGEVSKGITIAPGYHFDQIRFFEK